MKKRINLLTVKGRGLLDFGGKVLNRAIDLLPVELHIPGYQFCGPGTKLQTRLNRGDSGINKLDEACKEHDLAYSQTGDSESRAKADRILAERAWQRVNASDATAPEKAAAWVVTNLMKVKSKFGGGGGVKRLRRRQPHKRRRRRRHEPKGLGLFLRNYKKGAGLRVKRSKKKPRRSHRSGGR